MDYRLDFDGTSVQLVERLAVWDESVRLILANKGITVLPARVLPHNGDIAGLYAMDIQCGVSGADGLTETLYEISSRIYWRARAKRLVHLGLWNKSQWGFDNTAPLCPCLLSCSFE